jgi:hypothetical protein
VRRVVHRSLLPEVVERQAADMRRLVKYVDDQVGLGDSRLL